MKKYVSVLFTALVLLTVSQSAVSKDNIRYGLGWNIAKFSVDDPNGLRDSGSTDSETVSYFSGIATKPIDRNNKELRLWYELKYRSFTLEPTTISVGQDVKSLSISTTAQFAWSASRIGAYWLGVGGELSFDDFNNRTIVDQDGFLARTFGDRKKTNIGLILNTGFNFRKSQKGFYSGFNVNLYSSFNDGIDGISVTSFVLW